jgi:hypothetical protein
MKRILLASMLSTRANESFRKFCWIRSGEVERSGHRGNGGCTFQTISARGTENTTFTIAKGYSNARMRSPDGKGTIRRGPATSLKYAFRSPK